MKKLLVLFLALILFIPMGCGNSTKDNDKSNDKIKYFAEFKYLPEYPGAEKVSFEPSDVDGGFSKASYKLTEKDIEKSTTDYKAILEKDGWTAERTTDSFFLDCKKGDHSAAILFADRDGTIMLDIIAK